MGRGILRTSRALGLAMLALAVAMAVTMAVVPAGQAQAIATRATDVAVAGEDSCLLGIDGTFYSDGKAVALAAVNKIRKEACDKGVPDPRDKSRKLTSSDYVAMRWSSDLEKIAQTRAAEGSICESHTRPNGDSCFGAYAGCEVTSNAECLAWNGSASMLEGISQWYEEKADWVAQNGAVTGHYTALINPSNTHMGLGAFASDQSWGCVAGEFTDGTWYEPKTLPEDEIGVTGKCRQTVEVRKDSVAAVKIVGNAKLKGAVKRTYSARVTAKFDSLLEGTHEVLMVPLGSVAWKCSSPTIATVSANGQVSAKKCGTAKLYAAIADAGKNGSTTLTVVPADTKLKSLSAKKKALKATWKSPASLADGYELRYSTKKSMKGAKTITVKGASKGAKTLKKLKAKKKYYVQVRAFAKVDGKSYYSAWSTKKTKKTK